MILETSADGYTAAAKFVLVKRTIALQSDKLSLDMQILILYNATGCKIPAEKDE
jgi:hypothetical protein